MKNLVLGAAALAVCATVSAADVSVVNVSDTNDTAIEEVSSCPCLFSGMYFGLGLGLKSAKVEGTAEIGNIKGSRKFTNTNLIGSLVLGGGKAVSSNWYLGAEVLWDFSKNKKKDYEVHGLNVKLQNGGVIPSFAARIGYIIPSSKIMTYAKVGISLLHDKAIITNLDNKMNMNKVVPLLALGVEKPFCNKFSLRTDLEYSFKGSKSDYDSTTKMSAKLRNKGVFNWRVFFTYNVKI